MKRRSLTVLLCLLAIISLASVGFASWVISAGDTENAEGTFKVEEVVDERLEIKNLYFDTTLYQSSETELPKFVFGTPEGATQDGWLTNKTIGTEKLTIKVTFEVYYKDTKNKVPENKVDVSVAFSVLEDAFKVDETTYYAKIGDAPKVSYDSVNGKYSCTLTVKWGNYFNGVDGTNPYTYYNGQKIDEKAEEAKLKLTAMYDALNVAKYKVTINATNKK